METKTTETNPNIVSPIPTKELQDRVASATRETSPSPVVDRFTGKLSCYRSITLAPIGREVSDALTGKRLKVDFQPGTIKCIGIECSRWNDEQKECFDNTQAKAASRTADILDLIDGHARMSAGK